MNEKTSEKVINITCKNCEHFKVCYKSSNYCSMIMKDGKATLKYKYDNEMDKKCKDFQDVTKTVHTPCAIGADIYLILNTIEYPKGSKKAVFKRKAVAFGENHIIDDLGSFLRKEQIGKLIFFNEAEAFKKCRQLNFDIKGNF